MSIGKLRAGLAVAKGVAGVNVGDPPYVEDAGAAWLVPVTISIESPSKFVAATTSWLLRVDKSYPFGGIDLYPAVRGGMTATFQHQEPNIDIGGRPYRSGKLCLDNPYRLKMVATDRNDPTGDADGRVSWYLKRAVEWLRRAASNELVRGGDFFEVPRYIALRERVQLVHDEARATRGAWAGRERSWGRITWRRPIGGEKTFVAARYVDARGGIIRECSSRAFDSGDLATEGIWWLWPEPVVVPPWQAPLTWNDLRTIGATQGVDVNRTLRAIAAATRGRDPVILMIGYPIPARWAEDAAEIHWQAFEIGAFEHGKPANGFRSNEAGWWQRDSTTKFRGGDLMVYANTENWHPDRLQARGRIAAHLTTQKVGIIGCGSLGSSIAELLARGGVRRMVLVDGETLETGNLVRHVLTVKDVGKGKAQALAAMLSAAAPLAELTPYGQPLPSDANQLRDFLEDCDVVIDCTATNEVPALLASTWWSVPPLFVSASVGFEARCTFLYRSRDHAFPADDFQRQLAPWLAQEQEAWSKSPEHVEGAGCYSPFFPARLDDIRLAAIAALRFIEQASGSATVETELLVLEKSGLAGLAPAVLLAAESHAAAV